MTTATIRQQRLAVDLARRIFAGEVTPPTGEEAVSLIFELEEACSTLECLEITTRDLLLDRERQARS